MAGARSYDSDLNLKATELRLALPGSDEPDQPTSTSTSVSSRKRSSSDLKSSPRTPSISDGQDDDCIAPPTKAQIIGWPPVQSHRKNSFQPKKPEKHANGSGLYVKVNMDGAPYLRKIDLKAYKSYAELVKVLEEMFKVKIGQYLETEGYSQSDFAPSYEDKDGDWMLVGDVPWEMFVSSCKRLRIIKSESKGLCL